MSRRFLASRIVGLLFLAAFSAGCPNPQVNQKGNSSSSSASRSASSASGSSSATVGKELTIDIADGVKLKLVLIPAKGKKFWMGSPETEKDRSENELQHEVEFTKDYYLGVFEVTQAQYRASNGRDPPALQFSKNGCGAAKVKGMNTDEFPVERVSWDDAKEFCDKLTEKAAPKGYVFRLPTEAEWEYACRGGDSEKESVPFYFKSGPSKSLSAGQINFRADFPYGGGKADDDKFLARTATVGSHPEAVNALGIYDMQGNTWEWCADWYGPYPKEKVTDPTGPKTGVWKVMRGGSWYNYGSRCRAACRYVNFPEDMHSDLGFRVAMGLK
jgi:formylglycine-generating enzyme required for sulfatase activity